MATEPRIDPVIPRAMKGTDKFCAWLRDEWYAGLQGIKIDYEELSREEATALLKKIKDKFRDVTGCSLT